MSIGREVGHKLLEGTALGNLSLLYHHMNEYEMAHGYGERALLITQDLGGNRFHGFALTVLGHVWTGLGCLAEAADSYEKALRLRQEIGEPDTAMEALAGLARVSLAKGELFQALAQVEEILTHIENNTLVGADEPLRVHLTCYHVLEANQDPRAKPVLEVAYRLLHERADRIVDEELRRSFLENVPFHREIVEEFQSVKKNAFA